MNRAEAKRYRHRDGRILWVGGIGKRLWMTMDSDPQAPGRHRFVSKLLPTQDSFADAQRDLDAYAAMMRFPEVPRE